MAPHVFMPRIPQATTSKETQWVYPVYKSGVSHGLQQSIQALSWSPRINLSHSHHNQFKPFTPNYPLELPPSQI